MENLFENAKFGDRFKTRDGRMAIFIKMSNLLDYVIVAIEKEISTIVIRQSGMYSKKGEDNFCVVPETSCLDIVSRWVEPIDEEKLDKLANDIYPDYQLSFGEFESCEDLRDAFKAGYRKAKQE